MLVPASAHARLDGGSFHHVPGDRGIRKREPWTIALSGLTNAQPVMNQFILDRQCNLSIFHEKLG